MPAGISLILGNSRRKFST